MLTASRHLSCLIVMSQPILVSIKDESQRTLVTVPSNTDQSAEDLHTRVLEAVERSHRGATARISYTCGVLGLSVSLGDVLTTARGQPLHQSMAPLDGVLVVTAIVNVFSEPRDRCTWGASAPALAEGLPNSQRATASVH